MGRHKSPGTDSGSQLIRLSIPNNDQATLKWLDTQSDRTLSLRLIIHDYVMQHGYTDRVWGTMSPTGDPILPPKSNTMRELRKLANGETPHPAEDTDTDTDKDAHTDESDHIPGMDADGFIDDPMAFLNPKS